MKVAVEWNDATNAKDPLDFINTFVKNGMSLDNVGDYIDLVLAATGKGANTPKRFKKHGTTGPTDTLAFEADMNVRRLKHLMLGKLLWNSFLSNF
eukprot:5297542-Ditylum_brightwellii.AAC.1